MFPALALGRCLAAAASRIASREPAARVRVESTDEVGLVAESLSSIPVVLVSGAEDTREAERLSAATLLRKPVDTGRLRATLEAFC